MRYVKLSMPHGMFRDPETGLTVKRTQVVPLGDRLGERTKQWLNAGGLVIVPGQTPQPAAASAEEPTAQPEVSLLSLQAEESAPQPEPEPEKKAPPKKKAPAKRKR